MGEATERSSNRRQERVRRFLSKLDGMGMVRVQALRGDDFETLTFAVGHQVADRAEELAAAFEATLQDEADAAAQVVRGRVAAWLDEAPDEDAKPASSMTVRVSPDMDNADVLPDGVYDGSAQGQIAQLQQLLQALFRMSIEERMAASRGFSEAIKAVTEVLALVKDQYAGEAALSAELKRAIDESGDAGAPWVEPALKALPQAMQALGYGVGLATRRAQQPAAAPQPPTEGGDQ